MSRIRVAAVVLHRHDGAVLTVRKRGTDGWMNPGGKPEPGEEPAACAVREVQEELGIRLDPGALDYLGDLSAAAANEPDHLVEAWVFHHLVPIDPVVHPAAEIDAVRWVLPNDLPDTVAPLFTERIAPVLAARGVAPWA